MGEVITSNEGKFNEQESIGNPEDKKSLYDIQEVCRRFNCVVAHGFFDNTGKPGFANENKVLAKPIGWQDSLKILIAKSPDISCSSFRLSTDDWKNTRKYGVFLKGGEIKHAGIGDLHSIAQNIKHRQVNSEPISPDLIEKTVSKRETDMNEMVVGEPEVAGFFVAKTIGPNGEYFPVPKGLYEISNKINMPVYFESDSEIYEANYRFFIFDANNRPITEIGVDESNMTRQEMEARYPDADYLQGSFYQGRKVTVEDILAIGPEISDDTKEDLKDEIMRDGLFSND